MRVPSQMVFVHLWFVPVSVHSSLYLNNRITNSVCTCILPFIGAVLTSKSQSDNQLEKAKHEAKKVIHALHKAQDKMDEFEVLF